MKRQLLFLRESLNILRQLPDVLRKFLNCLGHRCNLRCEVTQLCGELDQFDGWSFGTLGTCFAVAHNVDATVKSVDLLGELAEADQTENGNVLEESHAVGGPRLGYPGLFNDRLDLVLGTDSLGHSDTVGPDLLGALVAMRPVTVGSSY